METGHLPPVTLPSDTVTVADTEVPIRSLTRGQALTLKDTYADDSAGAEAYVLSCGVGVPFEDAETFIASAGIIDAGKLIDAILKLSGLAGPDPN